MTTIEIKNSTIAPLELYYRYNEESRVLSAKICMFTNDVRQYMDAFMQKVQDVTFAIYAPRIMDDYPNPEMNNKSHLSVLIPYLKEHLIKEGASNMHWQALRAHMHPLMVALHKMHKYLYAFKIICNIGEVDDEALRVFFCWRSYEMMTLYVLQVMNAIYNFRRTEIEWLVEDEEPIFDLCVNRYCAAEWGILKWKFDNKTLQERRNQRKANFEERYPPPPKRDMGAWCSLFMGSVAAVAAFKVKMGRIPLRVIDEQMLLPAIDPSFNLLAETGKAYDLLATYAPLSNQPAAVRMAVLKNHFVAGLLRAFVRILDENKVSIPGWIIEMISLHSCRETTLQALYDRFCTSPVSWSALTAL